MEMELSTATYSPTMPKFLRTICEYRQSAVSDGISNPLIGKCPVLTDRANKIQISQNRQRSSNYWHKWRHSYAKPSYTAFEHSLFADKSAMLQMWGQRILLLYLLKKGIIDTKVCYCYTTCKRKWFACLWGEKERWQIAIRKRLLYLTRCFAACPL